MKKNIKRVISILLIVLVGIQFFPTQHNQSYEILESDFNAIYNVPENIDKLLRESCYDCHSNNTVYPWYNEIQPLAWMMQDHINDGKEELNFSEFGLNSKRRKRNKLRSMVKRIEKDEMPLATYTFIHRDAQLSGEEKTEIIDWLESLIYP